MYRPNGRGNLSATVVISSYHMESGCSRPLALSIVANLRQDLSDIRTLSESRTLDVPDSSILPSPRLRRQVRHATCSCYPHMDGLVIAKQLLSALDRLIAQVADDAVLREGLARERVRLVACIEQQLGEPISEPSLPSTAREKRRPLSRRQSLESGPQRQRPVSVRMSCYRALAFGMLPSQRFDALMLLSRRALCRKSHSGSSSETPTSSSLGSSAGDSDGASGSDCEGSAPLRMNFRSTSTICA